MFFLGVFFSGGGRLVWRLSQETKEWVLGSGPEREIALVTHSALLFWLFNGVHPGAAPYAAARARAERTGRRIVEYSDPELERELRAPFANAELRSVDVLFHDS